MKTAFCRALALAGIVLLAMPVMGVAEVRSIEIDVTGYLCGM